MQKLFIIAALLFALATARAQPAPNSVATLSPLSLDQQSRISEIITNQTPQPLTGVNFSIAPGVVVPPDVTLQRLPVIRHAKFACRLTRRLCTAHTRNGHADPSLTRFARACQGPEIT